MIRSLILALLVLVAPAAARADVIYQVFVDTSGIIPSGTSGYLDFQLASSASGPAVTAKVSDFSLGTGTLGSHVGPDYGTPFGFLPGDLELTNTVDFTAYLHEVFSFGDLLSFRLTLSGPALDSPGPGLLGTTFALGIYDLSYKTLIGYVGNPDNFGVPTALKIDVSGVTGEVSIGAQADQVEAFAGASAVPAPDGWALLASAAMALAIAGLTRYGRGARPTAARAVT